MKMLTLVRKHSDINRYEDFYVGSTPIIRSNYKNTAIVQNGSIFSYIYSLFTLFSSRYQIFYNGKMAQKHHKRVLKTTNDIAKLLMKMLTKTPGGINLSALL